MVRKFILQKEHILKIYLIIANEVFRLELCLMPYVAYDIRHSLSVNVPSSSCKTAYKNDRLWFFSFSVISPECYYELDYLFDVTVD